MTRDITKYATWGWHRDKPIDQGNKIEDLQEVHAHIATRLLKEYTLDKRKHLKTWCWQTVSLQLKH